MDSMPFPEIVDKITRGISGFYGIYGTDDVHYYPIDDGATSLLFALSGLCFCFALYFVLELLEDDTKEEGSTGQPLVKDVGLQSVASSSAFRQTISSWSKFSPQEQIAAIDKFRSALEGKARRVPDDLTSLRFLRARRLRMDKALRMYERYLDWYTTDVAPRISVPMDEHISETLRRFCPESFIGRDPLGRPVKLFDVGQVDMASLKRQGITVSQVMDFHNREMELLWRCLSLRDASTVEDLKSRPGPDPDASLHAKDPLLGHTLILDTHNCTPAKFWNSMSLWRALAKNDQNYYPELLGKALFVRPPRLLRMAWNTIKPILDQHTVEKFEIIDGDPFDYLSELVGVENVPEVYRKHHMSVSSASAVTSDAVVCKSPREPSGYGCGMCWGSGRK